MTSGAYSFDRTTSDKTQRRIEVCLMTWSAVQSHPLSTLLYR